MGGITHAVFIFCSDEIPSTSAAEQPQFAFSRCEKLTNLLGVPLVTSMEKDARRVELVSSVNDYFAKTGKS